MNRSPALLAVGALLGAVVAGAILIALGFVLIGVVVALVSVPLGLVVWVMAGDRL